nr:MAG TPA: hypothetical protein [Caudoviricetes sp.]
MGPRKLPFLMLCKYSRFRIFTSQHLCIQTIQN